MPWCRKTGKIRSTTDDSRTYSMWKNEGRKQFLVRHVSLRIISRYNVQFVVPDSRSFQYGKLNNLDQPIDKSRNKAFSGKGEYAAVIFLLFFVKAVQSSYFQKIVLTLDQIEVIRKLFQAFYLDSPLNLNCGASYWSSSSLIIKYLSLINTIV